MKDLIRNILRENIDKKIELKSKSDKGNRYFKMLKTAEFQHYDIPKGELSQFTHGEEDRKRLVSNLSKEDKETYRKWLKTPEGEKSIEKFKLQCTILCNKDNLNENWFGLINEPDFHTKIKDNLIQIIVDEHNISEKSFDEYDNVIAKVKKIFKYQ